MVAPLVISELTRIVREFRALVAGDAPRMSLRSWAVFPVAMAFLFLTSQPAHANTITAASCSAANVQAAILLASSGDTVVVPGGTCTWSTPVTIPATIGIILSGGGNTTITNPNASLTVNSNATAVTEVTGFTFKGQYTNASENGAINVNGCGGLASCGGTITAAYRIDHNTFTDPSNNQDIFLSLSGNGTGLIDHNTFNGGGAAEEVHNLGMGPSDGSGWTDNVAPGSPTGMVYLENNAFNNSDTTFICSGIESFYGARTVLRNNTFRFCQIDQHGTAGSIGARWWEVYNNNFNVPAGQNQCCDIVMRAGSGVIWGNTQTLGSGSAGGDIELYEEDTGKWPLAYQIGSGINGGTDGHKVCGSVNSSPAYIWGNDPAITIDTNGNPSGTVFINEDFFVSTSQPATLRRQELSTDTCATTYNYLSFIYPYPWPPGGTAPAMNINAVAH